MKVFTLFFCSLFFLIGCGGGTHHKPAPTHHKSTLTPENLTAHPTTHLPPSQPSSRPQSKTSCSVNGGQWMVMFPNNGMGCNMSYTDAGKACSDNSQCQSQACQVRGDVFFESQNNPKKRYTGQCASSTHNKLNSCLNRLVNGRPVLQGCN